MKRVLVVDDEENMLWMLQRNLSNSLPEVETVTARSGEEALAVLSDKKVNLVITDISMPGMSGLDLLIEISNRYPETRVIVMTAYPSSAYEHEAMMRGCLRFIEKPFDIKIMRAIVEEILNQDEGFQGTIEGIELIDIVQFNGLSKATAALKVTTVDREGMIFFKNGEVVHAIYGEESGEGAFFEILGFHGGNLQNIKGVEPPVTSISNSLESLLIEATLKSDEVDRKNTPINDTPPSDTGPAISPSLQTDDSDEESEMLGEAIVDAPKQPETRTSRVTAVEILPPTTEVQTMTDIQKILAEFTNIDGVHTACLVGRDGFLLDSLARKGIDAEMIGAIASSGFGSAESIGNQLGQGDLTMTMIEYNNGPVLFAPVGTEAILVIVADKETNLGWIRIAIKKNSKAIQKIASL
jgi:predicted regulator of Ras-like GTPase activity (Roadblock/LC7/MglB family)/DNA-binding response OmpR family regulator